MHVRHVDAGSDGSEEWEIQALLGPVYDIHRLGVFFTASPRHADVLLVTGAGARGMSGPLRVTYDGMPEPKVVIAAGTNAVSGGLLSQSEAVTAGIAATVPVDVWLPGSPPSPFGILSALLIAVGQLAGGGRRTLALIGRAPGWLTGVLLVLGALSALLGIAHAAVQNRLSRVIAYSSIENTGLIVTGFGVALTGAAVGDPRLAAAGLLAATLQVVAHTTAKSLLFTSSAGIEAATGRDDLEELRGRARGTRWSGFGLAVGSVTLAGLPPTVGFVSEWFLLESLMQQFRVPGLGYRLVLALAGAAVALTVGFAGVTFVRIVGLIVLGRDTRRPSPAGASTDWAGRLAIAVLAVCCLAIAAVTPLEIRVIAAGLSPVVPGSLTMGALKSPWVLQPVFAGFSILSPSWLWVEMPLMLLLIVRSRGRPPAGGCCGYGGFRRGVRRRWASKAPTPTPRSATPTPLAGCWPACCTPAPRCAGHGGGRRRRRTVPRCPDPGREGPRAPAVHLRRDRGGGDLPIPARDRALQGGGDDRETPAVRPPGRLPALHAHRPGRRHRRGDRPGLTCGPGLRAILELVRRRGSPRWRPGRIAGRRERGDAANGPYQATHSG